MLDYLEYYSEIMLPAIEADLKESIKCANLNDSDELARMLKYHLGWETPDYPAGKSGKRIRPLLLLLTLEAANGNWQTGISAATAVELIHNFSLIHDDIQDQSALRRGRSSLWNIWGIPQAINAGDTMFSIANIALIELNRNNSPLIFIEASRIIHNTCLKLTQGQFLDILYENDPTIDINAYWRMISLKTAALISAATELGALIAGIDKNHIENYRNFGHQLGLAFQVEDDILGIWGQSKITGKPTDSDLVNGKLTLPILFAINNGGDFAKRWLKGKITTDEIDQIITLLEQEGAKEYCIQKSKEISNNALHFLKEANPTNEAGEALKTITQQLTLRTV